MYHLCREVETVKRFGRWASGSFSLYLWEADDAPDGLARGMVASEGRLEASHGLGASVSRQQVEEKRVRFALGGEVAVESGSTLAVGKQQRSIPVPLDGGLYRDQSVDTVPNEDATDELHHPQKVGGGAEHDYQEFTLGYPGQGRAGPTGWRVSRLHDGSSGTTPDGWGVLREHLQLHNDSCMEDVAHGRFTT